MHNPGGRWPMFVAVIGVSWAIALVAVAIVGTADDPPTSLYIAMAMVLLLLLAWVLALVLNEVFPAAIRAMIGSTT